MASRAEKPEVAQRIRSVRLFNNVVNLRVLPCDELAAELALAEVPGYDGEPSTPPGRRAVPASSGVRSLWSLQWRAVRRESFRHLLSTPA